MKLYSLINPYYFCNKLHRLLFIFTNKLFYNFCNKTLQSGNAEITVFCSAHNESKFIIKASYACSEEASTENIMFNKP